MQILLAASLLAGGCYGLYGEFDGVKVSTAASFSADVLESPLLSMVEFFAPWCGHCQQAKPVYKEVAKKLDGLVNVVAVDCDDEANKALCAKYDVRGFPTFKTFRLNPRQGKHEIDDYQGPRAAKDIIAHLSYMIPSKAKMIRDADMAKLFAASAQAASAPGDGEGDAAGDDDAEPAKVILYTNKDKVPPILKVLSTLYPSLDFFVVNEKQKQLVDRFSIDQFPTLLAVRGAGASRRRTEKYLGDMKVADIAEWLSKFAPNDNLAKRATGSGSASGSSGGASTPAVEIKAIADYDALDKTCIKGSKPCFAIPADVRLGRYETQFDKYTLVTVPAVVAAELGVDVNTFVLNGAKGWVLPAKQDLDTLERVLAFRDDIKLGQAGKKRRLQKEEL